MTPLNSIPIRWKLTLWHSALFGGIMLSFILGSLGFFYVYLLQHQDAVLKEDIEVIQQFLRLPLDDEFRSAVQSHAPEEYERFCEVWSESGGLLYRSAELSGHALGPPPSSSDTIPRFIFTSLKFENGTRWRVVGSPQRSGGHGVFLRLAVSEQPILDELWNAARILGILFPFVILLVAAGGYVMAGRVLKPIELMSATARRISTESLDDRLPILNASDEFGSLATTLNDLLERVRRSLDQMKRFTSDVSHELRTPLTAMRSVGEVGLHSDRSISEYREIIGSMLEENDRLTNLIDKLLFLSRADAGRLPLERSSFSLSGLVEELAEVMKILAEEKGQTILTEVHEVLEVLADRGLLRQAIMGLVDNAIKYSPTNSHIRISLSADDSSWNIVVQDEGPGISLEHQDRVFDRFSRIDGPLTRRIDGSGLGLSIVQWIVHAHAGSVTILPNTGKGTAFRISLPRSLTR
jgi:heavy metal sensor kinase